MDLRSSILEMVIYQEPSQNLRKITNLNYMAAGLVLGLIIGTIIEALKFLSHQDDILRQKLILHTAFQKLLLRRFEEIWGTSSPSVS